MDADQIAFGVKNESHPANWRHYRLDLEFHFVHAQMRDGFVKVFNFQSDGAAVRARRPIRRTAAERKRAAGDVIFRPSHPAGFAENHRGFQAEHAFVKFPRPRHVLDWITTERDFGDFEHKFMYRLVSRPSDYREHNHKASSRQNAFQLQSK